MGRTYYAKTNEPCTHCGMVIAKGDAYVLRATLRTSLARLHVECQDAYVTRDRASGAGALPAEQETSSRDEESPIPAAGGNRDRGPS